MSALLRRARRILCITWLTACGVGREIGPLPPAVDAAAPMSVDPCEAAGIDGDAPEPLTVASGLLIDDFDQSRQSAACSRSAPNWEDPLVNNLGYCAECYNDCNGAQGGQLDAVIVTHPEHTLRCRGGALELDFDVSQSASACNPSPMPRAYAGFVEVLVANDLCTGDRGPFNLDNLNVQDLSFWVAAEEGSDDWDLEVALKDSQDHQSPKLRVRADGRLRADPYLQPKLYAGGWQRVRIPLPDFLTGIEPPNLRELREVNFTFTAGVTQIARGKLYLDEIAFVR